MTYSIYSMLHDDYFSNCDLEDNELRKCFLEYYLRDFNISVKEMSCHDKAETPYPVQFPYDRNLNRLCSAFQDIRNYFGCPLEITSSFRTEKHNARIGGSRRSYHVQGKAIDIAYPKDKDFDLREFHIGTLRVAKQRNLIGGIGFYWWGVHVDLREKKSRKSVVEWYKLKRSRAQKF